MLELKNKDKWIFKYMPFGMNAIKIIVNEQLWFGKPDIQNDPYEIEFIVDYINTENKKYYFDFPLNNDLEKHINYTNSGKIIEHRNDFEECLKRNIRNYVGICSFSEKCDDILMWSHYADANKGICLVFNKESIIKGLRADLKEHAEYEKDMPHVNFSSDEQYGTIFYEKDFFIHKSIEWEYEDEFRFVRIYKNSLDNDKINRLHLFDIKSIEGIIVGEKFSQNDFQTLSNLITKRDSCKHIKFWKCKKNINKSKMEVYSTKDINTEQDDSIKDISNGNYVG